jgi:hypothetical protein
LRSVMPASQLGAPSEPIENPKIWLPVLSPA